MGGIFGGGGGPGLTVKGPSTKQINTAYDQTQDAIKQQNDFVAALQAQNGLSNQASVFNQQQALANQLQGVANGTGPNPALNQLQQATGENVSNQAALMASQRGAGANVGMIARQAALQGGQIQQQAVGQAATMQAQQQIAAMQQLAQQQAAMGNMANTQIGQLQQGQQQYSNAALNQQQNLYSAKGAADSANAALSQQATANKGNMIGSLMGAAGTVIGGIYGGPAGASIGASLGSAVGGIAGGTNNKTNIGMDQMVSADEGFAEGGLVGRDEKPIPKGPRSQIGQHFLAMAQGGKVPALVSPGERYLDPSKVEQVKQGADPIAIGEKIPGKPKVGGAKNSYANDTVRKDLDAGGIVLPRSVTQSKDPHKAATDFINAVFAKNKLPSKK